MQRGIGLRDNDLVPLGDFPLRSRWTDPSYDVLPPEALSTIRPIRPVVATSIWAAGKPLIDPREETLSRKLFAVEQVAAPEGSQAASAWLAERLVPETERVIVSWQPREAVLTTAATFTAYWGTFCYSVSDDVCVYPLTQCWALLYHHYETFHYGMWRLE